VRGGGEPGDAEDPEDDPGREVGGQAPPIRILEALLFSANEPLSVERLRSLAGLEQVRDLVAELRREYDVGGHAFTIEEVAGGFRLYTRPEFAEWVGNLRRRETTTRLSPAALETLAIVAYRQPVLRADIEKIRGVDVGGALRTLLERGLAKVVGRAEEPGSPLLYGTTRRFLEVFGLKSLAELPKRKDLK
jgi:segregation and condensation protein B